MGRDVYLAFAVVSRPRLRSIGPVATATVTANDGVNWKVTTHIAVTPLAPQGTSARHRVASVRDPAKVKAPAQHREAKNDAVPTHRPKAERGAAPAARVGSVSATKTLMGREMALIGTDGGEDERTHGRSAI